MREKSAIQRTVRSQRTAFNLALSIFSKNAKMGHFRVGLEYELFTTVGTREIQHNTLLPVLRERPSDT